MINNINSVIGLKTEDAVSMLDGMDIKITDFSRPDKYHKDIPQSKRVVKVVVIGNNAELFVAGFADDIQPNIK